MEQILIITKFTCHENKNYIDIIIKIIRVTT